MSIFDLLFVSLVLSTVMVLLRALYSAVRGRKKQSLSLLRRAGIVWAVYMGVMIAASAIRPRKVLAIGENRCYDDWCIAAERVDRSASANLTRYTVTLRLSSRARRVSQRENGIAVYVTDNRGRRFDAVPDASAVGLNVMLGPQESVATKRLFDLPADAREPGLVIAHEGGIPMGWLIVGDEGWFRKPAIVRLSARAKTDNRSLSVAAR